MAKKVTLKSMREHNRKIWPSAKPEYQRRSRSALRTTSDPPMINDKHFLRAIKDASHVYIDVKVAGVEEIRPHQ